MRSRAVIPRLLRASRSFQVRGAPAALASLAASLLVAAIAAAPAQAAAVRDAARELRFDVFLDERPIGYQRFALQPTAEGLRIEIRAAFEFTLLRLKSFAYDHRNVEQWRGGCLESIESSTEQNGKPYRVTGRAEGKVFSVSSDLGRQQLSDCVGTFAYWDKREILKRTKLLNSQTGEYVPVATRSLGRSTLAFGGREVPVDRYVIEGDDLEITLAYATADDEWLALDSPLWGGWTLRYRRSADALKETQIVPSAAPAASKSSAEPR
jgi:hypothetical protein